MKKIKFFKEKIKRFIDIVLSASLVFFVSWYIHQLSSSFITNPARGNDQRADLKNSSRGVYFYT